MNPGTWTAIGIIAVALLLDVDLGIVAVLGIVVLAFALAYGVDVRIRRT